MNSAVSKTISRNRSSVARSPALAGRQLGVVDRVRLLPDQERADARRRLRAARLGHLGPARAGVALSRRRGPRAGQDRVVAAQAPLQHRPAGPTAAKCAACHQCISRWNLPYQLLQVRPVSCGGKLPAHWIAVRYCDSTIRRSSSRQRGSRLPDRSIAPPVDQKRCQCSPRSPAVFVERSGGLPRCCEPEAHHPVTPKNLLPAAGSGTHVRVSPSHQARPPLSRRRRTGSVVVEPSGELALPACGRTSVVSCPSGLVQSAAVAARTVREDLDGDPARRTSGDSTRTARSGRDGRSSGPRPAGRPGGSGCRGRRSTGPASARRPVRSFGRRLAVRPCVSRKPIRPRWRRCGLARSHSISGVRRSPGTSAYPTFRPCGSNSLKRKRSMAQPSGLGAVCQPHCESVPSGIVGEGLSEGLQARHVGGEGKLAVARPTAALRCRTRAERGGGG